MNGACDVASVRSALVVLRTTRFRSVEVENVPKGKEKSTLTNAASNVSGYDRFFSFAAFVLHFEPAAANGQPISGQK